MWTVTMPCFSHCMVVPTATSYRKVRTVCGCVPVAGPPWRKNPLLFSCQQHACGPRPPWAELPQCHWKEADLQGQAFMRLIVLPYGQRALQGQAINFPVNASELFSSLPRPVDRAGIILIYPPQGSSSDSSEVQRPSQYYAVRRPYVLWALQWLKAHNQLYSDVEIDNDSLNEPEAEPDQQRPRQESDNRSPEFESSVIRRDFTLPNVDVQDVIRDGNAPVHQLERVRGVPVSLFSDREAEQLAFSIPFPRRHQWLSHSARSIHINIGLLIDTPPE